MTPPPPASATETTGFGRTTSAMMAHVHLGDDAVPQRVGIARGAGCSYGDQSLCSDGVGWRVPAGITDRGVEVEVAAGTTLHALVRHLWPTGRTLAVLPGSFNVTIGGAVAADIHGKNHVIAGSFAHLVRGMRLATPTGMRDLRPGEWLFDATTGGMGLTGVIQSVRLTTTTLASAWTRHVVRPASGIDEVIDVLDTSADEHAHVAAWMDLLGPQVRGLVECTDVLPAAPADVDDPFPVPAPPRVSVPRIPMRLLTRPGLRAFNETRWRRRSTDPGTMPLASALVPLGAVDGFAHLYGPTGLVQHQCLVPVGHRQLLVDIVEAFRDGPGVPALAVLKRLGDAGTGHLSFPGPGWTLAVDFPANTPQLGAVLDEVDRQLAAVGGRIYLAKDATARPAAVAAMHPRLDQWRAVADEVDPDHLLTSNLDRRVGLRRDVTGSTGPADANAQADATGPADATGSADAIGQPSRSADDGPTANDASRRGDSNA